MNVRAGHLGADPDNPQEFAEWLHLGSQGRDAFLPRLAYGEYLTHRLQQASDRASNLSPVSYTHLDVYKRQVVRRSWSG